MDIIDSINKKWKEIQQDDGIVKIIHIKGHQDQVRDDLSMEAQLKISAAIFAPESLNNNQ
jgi:hypothetical protein